MDDQDDRGYSRAAELENLLSLCKALNAEGVRYVLIGGFAVILQGFVRGTKNIDLLVDTSPENVQRLKRAMAVLPDNAIALIADDAVATPLASVMTPIVWAPLEKRQEGPLSGALKSTRTLGAGRPLASKTRVVIVDPLAVAWIVALGGASTAP
ncbi:MAG: hypothetical protein M3P29_05740 [Acidobacteriota bacterium]|nr:hypothetical protein [Acidobacteriota bacterium]